MSTFAADIFTIICRARWSCWQIAGFDFQVTSLAAHAVTSYQRHYSCKFCSRTNRKNLQCTAQQVNAHPPRNLNTMFRTWRKSDDIRRSYRRKTISGFLCPWTLTFQWVTGRWPRPPQGEVHNNYFVHLYLLGSACTPNLTCLSLFVQEKEGRQKF